MYRLEHALDGTIWEQSEDLGEILFFYEQYERQYPLMVLLCRGHEVATVSKGWAYGWTRRTGRAYWRGRLREMKRSLLG